MSILWSIVISIVVIFIFLVVFSCLRISSEEENKIDGYQPSANINIEDITPLTTGSNAVKPLTDEETINEIYNQYIKLSHDYEKLNNDYNQLKINYSNLKTKYYKLIKHYKKFS